MNTQPGKVDGESASPQGALPQVAIVGAGMAGVAAGILLREAGAAGRLFEKSRGPGGRMASKRVGEASVDMGAQYFTVRSPSFARVLERYASGSYAPWQAELRIQKGEGDAQVFFPEARYVGVPRMSAVTRALAKQLQVNAGVRIERIERDEQRDWWLLDDAGVKHGPFSVVLCTAPPAQSKALFASSNLISLAEHPVIAEGVLKPCWAVAVSFENSLGLPFQGLQTEHPVLAWLANNSSKPGRKGDQEWWVLHATPEWSSAHQDASVSVVQSALLEAFYDVTQASGFDYSEIVAHRWLYARYEQQPAPGYLWFAEQQIGVLGDWLQGGRVEGAFSSASRWVGDWLAGQLAQTQP